MAIFKHTTIPGRAKPEGGYGSYGTPSRAQAMSAKKGKPGKDSGKSVKAHKPKGGYGPRGKPVDKPSKGEVDMGTYGADGMSWPKATIPKDQKRGRFNLPKGKFI